jgi:phytoene dehydrogenase-like protein
MPILRKALGFPFGVLFALHAALHRAPDYASASWDPLINQSFNTCIGYETPEEVVTHLDSVVNGYPPEVIGLQATCPTLFDTTRAPAGKHVLLAWQFAPYDLADGGPGGWQALKHSYLQKVLDRWALYAPNLTPDNVIYSFPQTPVDTA